MADNQVLIDIKVDYEDAIYGVQRFKDQIAALKAEQKKLSDDLLYGRKTTEEYRLAMTKNEEAIKQAKTQMRQMSKEVQSTLKVEKETGKTIDLLNASYNQLSATYTQMKTRINQMSAAEREANREYIESSKQVYERMKELQEETGKYQLNVGNYKNAILSAVGANNMFAQSLIAMGSGSTSASSAIKQFSTSLLPLLTNPVFLAIAGVAAVGAAFKFWSDYNDGISEATRLTREFLTSNGIIATNEQLSAMRSEIQAIADTYGKEYKETLQAVDTLMSQFGGSAAAAMDVLNKGFAAGADLNGDFLQQIQQYAPAFRDAGGSMEELVSLIAQTRSGIFSKEGMDIIVKASKSLRDMSSATKDALQGIGIDADELARKLASGELSMLGAIQQVSNGLKSVSENSQEAGAVIDNVFGKKGTAAGQQQAKAIADINTELSQVLQTTGEYGELQLQIEEQQKRINQATEQLFGMNGWDVMKKQAELYALSALASVLQGIVDIYNWFVRLYNTSGVVRGAVAGISGVFKMLYNVATSAFKLIVTAGEAAGKVLEGIVHLNFGRIQEGVTGFYKNIAGGIKGAFVDGWNGGMKEIHGGHLDELQVRVTPTYRRYNEKGGSTNTTTPTASTSPTSPTGGRGGGSTGNTTQSVQEDPRVRLEQALQEELTKISIKAEQDRAKQINMEFDKRIEDTRAKYAKIADTEEKAEAKIKPLIDAINEERKQALAKYNKEQFDAAVAQRQKLIQLQLENAQTIAANDAQDEAKQAELFRAKLAALAIQYQMERDQYANNQEMLLALEQQYNLQRAAATRTYFATITDIEKKQQAEELAAMEARATNYGKLVGSMSGLLSAFGEQSEEAAIASKILAVAQIAIEQAVAIAKATAAGAGVGFPGNIAAIASGIAAVVGAIASATKSLNKAKIKRAQGGIVEGAGTETSDSIPAMLSNGESVVNARSTRAFAPLLSTINQLGGGVPINVSGTGTEMQGEAMLSRSFAMALRELPTPVVAVSEIERVGNRVKVIENFSQV